MCRVLPALHSRRAPTNSSGMLCCPIADVDVALQNDSSVEATGCKF
eukprot:COSAG02_NODE_18052_length_964_cov_1.098266_3_plen_45_part_01